MKLDVSKVVTQNHAKQKNNYDGRTQLREFQLGSNALVKNFCQGSKRIAGTVKEKVGLLSYMTELPNDMCGSVILIIYIFEKEEGVNQNLE